MAENEKVKVIGYAQRTFFDNGIEYRNFADNLVGNQLTDDGGTALFTLGNFKVTTNLSPRISKIFRSKKFSNFVTLSDLDLTCDEVNTLLKNNAEVKLKLDKSDLCNYAYFGSTVEYIRVTLEGIISDWPASLYMDPILTTSSSNTGHTMQDYTYDVTNNEATFQINTNTINNKFEVNFLRNGTIVDTFNESNDLRNLTVNYANYVVSIGDTEYKIKEFTGATNIVNSLIKLVVDGNPFTGTSSFTKYHIKPKSIKVEEFFNGLGDLDTYLLNRMVTPQYSAKFRFPTITEEGVVTFKDTTVKWPTTDGYNIDFDTTNYVDYVGNLLEIATNSDVAKSNLIVRFLTSDSISDFDTLPNCDGTEEETAGQKMNRTLKVYGREFDEIKRYMDGIQWANTVTYNQVNNTPDLVLKNLARTLGWDLVSSVLENDLLKSYVEPKDVTFSGHSRGLTPIEAEYEMWRRLVLNSAWLFKSKGTRKGVEFLFKFIGAPNGLMTFNEFIYKTNKTIDVDQFKAILEEQGNDEDLSLYSLDDEGYPRAKPNTPELYFQKGGLWWRETGGSGSTIDMVNGNNPHVGPYDAGQEYMNQFDKLISDFTPVVITESTILSADTNIFINYNSGLINNSLPLGETSDVYFDVLDDNNQDQSGNVAVTTSIIEDPFPTAEMTDCGCETGEGDHSIRINITKNLVLVAKLSPTLDSCLYRLPFAFPAVVIAAGGCTTGGFAKHIFSDFVVNGVPLTLSGPTSFELNCGNTNIIDLDGDTVFDTYDNVSTFLNAIFQNNGLSNYYAQPSLTPLINPTTSHEIEAQTFYVHRPVGDTFSFRIFAVNETGVPYGTYYYEEGEAGTIITIDKIEEKYPNAQDGSAPWLCGFTAELIDDKMLVVE